MKEKGFAPIIVIFSIVILATVFFVSSKYVKPDFNFMNYLPFSKISPSPTPTDEKGSGFELTNLPGITPTSNPRPTTKDIVTINKTKAPTAKPTATTTNTNTTASCNYDLSSASGTIQLVIQPQSGYVSSSTYGYVYAKAGCKVLDGRSTDSQGKNGSPGSNPTIVFNSVPPGTYTVKITWAGNSSNTQTVTVTSGQSSAVYFSVTGDSSPTTAPIVKPSCSLGYMNLSGVHKVCVGITSNPLNSITGEYVDYEGDGIWDYSGSQYGCHDYNYSVGTHTAKAKVTSPGVESDICQTTFTVN